MSNRQTSTADAAAPVGCGAAHVGGSAVVKAQECAFEPDAGHGGDTAWTGLPWAEDHTWEGGLPDVTGVDLASLRGLEQPWLHQAMRALVQRTLGQSTVMAATNPDDDPDGEIVPPRVR